MLSGALARKAILSQGVKGRSRGVEVYKFLNSIIAMRLEFLAWLRAVSEMFNYIGISIAEFWKLVTSNMEQKSPNDETTVGQMKKSLMGDYDSR